MTATSPATAAAAPERTGLFTSVRARYLMPVAFVTYSLAYLDKSNYAIASAGGMADDLGLSTSADSLIAASFFLGYFFFQIPGTLYAEQRSARRLVAWSTVAWGLLAVAQGLLGSPGQLIAVRFALGVVEGAVLPSMVMLLGRWFTRGERGRANTLLILGNPVTVMWLSAVSGWLVSVSDWRVMFVAEGIPSVLWGLACLWLIKDRPEQYGRLPEHELARLRADLAAERAAAPPVTGTLREQYGRVLRSPAVLTMAAQYFFWSFGMYGFVFWLPAIIKKGSGEGIGATGLLTAVPYACAAAAMLLNSRLSDRSGRRRRAVWPWLACGGLALAASYAAGDHFPLALALLTVAGLCLYAPYGPYFAFVTSLAPPGIAGAAIALVNSLGALGSFAGTYLVGWVRGTPLGDAGAFGFMAACALLSAGLTLAVPEPAAARPARVP
ncbi:MFS transporter [Streptomyces thermodiastaticus]|jgi:sugar phosphate permease|uniref:MFS transporter n=1 Tax=Streptomyces thermodiastaticus TaxID=44061 RepID=UPI0016799AD6|nr:MFS transporter [Streptomyces thermodiastaticus]MCE7552078.1 MFS transporter [Streptomyces thermodiastaticus]GHF78107.1 MFS transporter [Streptomyces thermodiastaticus]